MKVHRGISPMRAQATWSIRGARSVEGDEEDAMEEHLLSVLTRSEDIEGLLGVKPQGKLRAGRNQKTFVPE